MTTTMETPTEQTPVILQPGEATTIRNQDVAESIHGLRTLNVESFSNGFFFSITLRKWGNRAKVKNMAALAGYIAQLNQEREAALNAGVDPSILRAGAATFAAVEGTKTTSTSKVLLRSEPLDALNEFLTGVKDRLCGRFGVAMPSGIKEGLFVVPAGAVADFEAQLKRSVEQLTGSWVDNKGNAQPGFIPAFLADYEAAIERARVLPLLQGGLGPLFDLRDYPTASEVAELFELTWGWLALGVPAGLPESIRAEATKKFNDQVNEAAAECKSALYVQLGEFLEHATEKLSVKPGDKAPVFRNSITGNIADFCEVFSQRNQIFNDAQLGALVEEVKKTLIGVTPERLRTFANVRTSVKEQFEAIKAKLDAGLVASRGRRFDFSE